MTRNKKLAVLLAAFCALYVAVIPAYAQTAKIKKAHFTVLHMMSTGIQVRGVENEREIHTFTYSDRIRGEMQNRFNSGSGYQYGDKVVILYEPGAEVALHIKGKPSKPVKPA